MNCPHCGATRSENNRWHRLTQEDFDLFIRRYYRCRKCLKTFRTWERFEPDHRDPSPQAETHRRNQNAYMARKRQQLLQQAAREEPTPDATPPPSPRHDDDWRERLQRQVRAALKKT